MQQEEEEKADAFDMTITEPDNASIMNNNHETPIGPNKDNHDNADSKEIESNNNNNNDPNNPPQRQSMSPQSIKSTKSSASNNPFDDDKNSIINNCAVLIIPLDKRVTPQMVANKFVKYGKILQVRPIKKSSTCIVIFSKASEAANCIRLFQSHDKVRVTRPDQCDWNMCDEAISIQTRTIYSNSVSMESVESAHEEKEALNNKIAIYENHQSRISIMYKQRHSYQMLFENDDIERRKRLKNNKLMLSRIEVMFKTSEELYFYLKKMIDLEIKHEENIHKSIINTFGMNENGGSVHSAGIAIDALLKNRYEQFNDINDRVFKNILLSSQKYQNKLKQQLNYFQNRINKFNDKCEQNKIKLSQQWNKYQNVLNRTLKALQSQQTEGKQSNKSHSNIDTQQIDPFIAGKSYDLTQREYKAALNEYNEEMSRLFNKVVIEDKKRIDGIKTILIDYFLAEKAKAMNHVKLIESSLEYIKCVDKEHDTGDFIKKFAHIQHTVYTPNSSLSPSATTDNNDDDEDKDKNKNKKKIKKAVSQPIINTKGVKPKIIQTPEGILIEGANVMQEEPVSFNFSESETFTIHSKELSDLIYTDIIKKGKIYRPGRIMSSNWKPIYANITKFGFFHCFEKKYDIKPIISIYLKNTNIKIKDNDKKYGLFTFEIIVPNSSWFSLTGTPTKYIYKSNTYNDCIEWINHLKKYTN